MEKTYVMLKPDAYKRRLVGEIISRIEKKNLQITGLVLKQLDKKIVTQHYAHIKDRPEIFNRLLEFMTSGPVVCMVVQGPNAVAQVRHFVGTTNPQEAQMGTIRGDYATDISQNIIHASDSVENAKIEIKRFFG